MLSDIQYVDWQGYLQSSSWPHVGRCCIEHHFVAKTYHIPLPTKETDEPKRDTASTDLENDDVETDQQKQGTIDVTSDITEAIRPLR